MSELPVCLYCSVVDHNGRPCSSRTWVVGGYRHAAISHAATLIVAAEGIPREEALERLRSMR